MAVLVVNHGFGCMRETRMAHVMQQARQPDKLPPNCQRFLAQFGDLLEVRLQEGSALRCEFIKGPSGKLHHAEGMLETRVSCTRIHHFGERELPNVSQAPKNP